MEKKRKKEEVPEQAPQIPVEQPTQDYTPDQQKVRKDLYFRDRDTFFADERLYRQDSVTQRETLGKFFDNFSVSYYNDMGLTDVNTIKELRQKFIDDNIGKLSLAKKKEVEEQPTEVPEVDYPDFVDKSQISNQFYSRQDIIKPVISDTYLNKANEGYKAVRAEEEKIAGVVPKLLEHPDYNYIKTNPEQYVLLEGFGEKKKVEKYLKEQGIPKEERSRILDMLHYTATRSNIEKLKAAWDPEKLNLAVDQEAVPYVKDVKPGTFIDPLTGQRKLQPETEEDADQLALIQKYMQEIRNGAIASSPDNPLSKKKEQIDQKQDQLVEAYQQVEELRKVAQDSLKGALIATSPEVDAWKKAQIDLIKMQSDLEKEINDFNEAIDTDKNIAGAITGNPSDKQRLQQIVQDSFIEKKFWDKEYDRLNKIYKETSTPYADPEQAARTIGFRPAPISPAMENARRMKYEKTAMFEAASRMYYANEGPMDIKKDAKYQLEVLGDAILKGVSHQDILGDKVTEQQVLMKMGELGMREGLLTDEELDYITPGFLEQVMSFSGSLAADLPMLMLVGGATNAVKSIPLISKLRYGHKVIQNPVLKEAGKPLTRTLRFADPVPTGWKVISEVKPTAISKLKGTIISSVIDEAAFTGMMGMTPGFMTGINTAHLFLPEVKLKGKWGNILQPFIDTVYKSAIGATAGMEAGLATTAMANALLSDSTIKQEMDNLYPNLDEVTKRVLVELTVNGIFFGGMGALTTGSQKAMTAPLGAKWGKSGGTSWTAYFNPKMRARVFEAARTADSKGYTDTAKELYRWLDMTKEPITGKDLKMQRLAEVEGYARSLPVGTLRMAVDANRDAIRVLENLNNDPNFDGYVTIKTSSAKDVKPTDVVQMDGKYYEVSEIAKGKDGKPIEFTLIDIESGQKTKALTEDVKTDIYYKVGSRLELGLRLENHYERLQVFNEVLADKGFYGKEAQALMAGPPPPKGLGRATGTFYVKPPEPTKIEKRLKRLEADKAEMQKAGIEPIEMPEKLRKEYPYGEPEKLMETPAGKFSENLAKAQELLSKETENIDKKLGELNKQLEGYSKREFRKERELAREEIQRLEYAKQELALKFEKEFDQFFTDSMPVIESHIKGKGDFSNEEIKEIIGIAWDKITNPSKETKDLSIGEIFDQSIAEFTGEKPDVKPVEPMDRMREIEAMAKAEGYTFTVNPDADPDRTVVDVADAEGRIIDWDELPRGIREMAEEFSELMHKEEIATGGEPSGKFQDDYTPTQIKGMYEFFGVKFDRVTVIRMPDGAYRIKFDEEDPIFIRSNEDLIAEFQKRTDADVAKIKEQLTQRGINIQKKETTKKIIPTAKPQFPEGFKSTITSKTDKMGVNKFTYALYEPDGKTKVSQLTFDIEEKMGEKWLSAPQIVTVTGQEKKGYATELYKYALQNMPEGISGIYSIASEIHDKGAVGAIHDKLAQFYNIKVLENGDKIIRPKKAEEATKGVDPEERRRFVNNQLVSLALEYNASGRVADKRNILQRINSLASEIGYTVKMDGKTVVVLNEKGKKARSISLKEAYDTLETIDDPGFKEFLGQAINAWEFFYSIDAPAMGEVGLKTAAEILLAGRGTKHTQLLVDALRQMYQRGELVFDDPFGTKMYHPVAEYMEYIKGVKAEAWTNFIAEYGDLTIENVEEAAKRKIIDKADVQLYKQAIAEEHEIRRKLEAEWAAEEARRAAGGISEEDNAPDVVKGKGAEPKEPAPKPSPEPKEYRYQLTLRPASEGGYPKEGLVKVELEPGQKFETLVYDRKLTAKERGHFDLRPLTEIADIKGKDLVDKDGNYSKISLKWHEMGSADVSMYDMDGELVEKPFMMSADDILRNIETGYWIVQEEKPAPKEKPVEPTKPGKPAKKQVDIAKDLKDMKDLLNLLGGPDPAGFGMEGGGEDEMKVRMNMMATKMIGKFAEAGITNFEDMLEQIIPQLDAPVLQRLLPFIKQGFGALSMNSTDEIMEKMSAQLPFVRKFGQTELDNLIARMNAPEETADDFSDVIGKEFRIIKNSKRITIHHVEEWGEAEYFKNVKAHDGLFAEEQKFPMLVVAFDREPFKYAKLETLRKGIASGQIVEIVPKPEYNNPERTEAYNKIAQEFEKLGDREMAEWIRGRAKVEPARGLTLEKDIENLKACVSERKLELQVKYGEIWFEPKPFTPLTAKNLFGIIDRVDESGDPLEPYIMANVPAETLKKVLDLLNEVNRWKAFIGMPQDGILPYRFLQNQFGGIAPIDLLLFLGQEARRIAKGDKRTKPEKIQQRLKQLDEAIVAGEKKLIDLKKYLFTHRIAYYLNNGVAIGNVGDLKRMAKEDFGITDLTTIRDQAEMALTMLAKRIAQNSTIDFSDRFYRIVALYESFPLQDRLATSQVKELKQFSTPVPLGFLMGAYTNSDVVQSVLDPTGGHGALVIFANTKNVRINEIDPNRFQSLLSQGYRVTNYDARESLKGKLDPSIFYAVNTNPPFGLDVEGDFKGAGKYPYTLSGTHYMVALALENMADEGKAAVIIGYHTKFDKDGYMTGEDLKFFNWLHSNFYVEDVIQIAGDLYSKMGTSFPTRLILINGRKPAFEGFAPQRTENDVPLNNWTDVFNRITKIISDPHEKSILQSKVDAIGRDGTSVRSTDSSKPKNTEDIGPVQPPPGEVPGTPGERPGETKKPTIGDVPKSAPGEDVERPGGPDTELPTDDKSPRGIENPFKRPTPVDRGEIRPPANPGDLPPDRSREPIERTGRSLGLIDRESDAVIPYVPLSRIPSGNEMVPGAMAQQLEDALMQLKAEVGDIDEYVMQKLKYNSLEHLASAFYGSQVDGVAMSIFNIENGDATIIGDQTGVGKGRIAAGAVAYAIENGFTPIFITKTANLFTDIYRDLFDIGKADYVPFIINKEYGGEVTKIYKPNSEEVMFTWDPKKYEAAIAKGELPKGTHFVIATYSQFNTDKGNSLKRREFLLSLAPNAVFIMDESHDASGNSNTGEFFKDFIQRAKGGVYLSATFAKRPDNLPIYAMKTVLREANMSYEDLVEAISNGGPALQEIISSQLAQSIQFTRRQLNMENIERNWYVLGNDESGSMFYNPELGKQLRKDYDAVTEIMREIVQFQRQHIKPVIEGMDKDIKKQGERAGIKKGTVDLGVDNYPYFSKVFNVVNQLLLSIKVKHVIPLIVDELRKGRKPFITLSSTMEAMIQDLNLEYDEVIEADFREVLRRGLNGVMRYTVKTPSGVPEHHVLDLSELSDMGSAAYKALMDKIRTVSTGISISPIDVLIKGIQDAGFKVAEITGRQTRFELSDDYIKGKYVPNRRPNKNKLLTSFNNEPGWAIIANVSGSTGLSAHSKPTYKDTMQRVGINLQPDLDVNVVVQKDGRINRSDQVNKPEYIHIISVLPAEKRIAMMNAKKLKSLYANTTSNQQSSKSITDTTDFLNKYGDQIVLEYLQENPDINDKMGNPVDLSKDAPETAGLAHKVTGKLAILPIDEQEAFYNEIIQRYEAEIDYLNATDQNDLEVKNVPLNAVTLEKEVAVMGKGGISVFGDDTVLETVEVDMMRKPLSKKQIDEAVSAVLGDKDVEAYTADLIAKMKAGIDEVYSKRIANLQQTYDAVVAAKRKEAESKTGRAEDIEYTLKNELEDLRTRHEDMIAANLSFAEVNKDRYVRLMRFFYPGRVLEVPFDASGDLSLIRMNKGIFLGFDINEAKSNPYAPSNVILRFATADSRRQFRVPASKDPYISQILANSYGIRQSEQAEIRETWDKIRPSREREKRYIVTGNILQGMAKFNKGRLIEFTMQDGTVRQGLLLPENFIKDERKKIVIPASKALNIVKGLAIMDYIESSSGNIQILKDRPTYDGSVTYQLRVPASRSRGEKYWGDKGLQDFVYDRIFNVHGDKMVGIVSEPRLEGLLNYIEKQYGETFEVRADNVVKGSSSQGSGIDMIREFERATKKVNGHGETRPEAEAKARKSKVDPRDRVNPEPIVGMEPKPIWQILKDFSDVVDQKIYWDKSVRRGAGSYTPALGKLVVDKLFKGRLDVSTHELGHALDDMFGLVGPEAEPLYDTFRPELAKLWQFGSKPPKGDPNPLMYQMREGVAEFFRAYIVNPVETARRFPEFTRWFEGRVKRMSPKVWDAIETLSKDVREYLGASGVDRMRKHVKWGLPKEGKVKWGWTSLFKPTSKMGDWIVTKFDLFALKWLNEGRIAEKAWRWAMASRGKNVQDPTKVPPSENFITLSHLLLGSMDKVGDMMMFGVTDNKLNRVIDPVTGEAVSIPWQYEAIPSGSLDEMKKFMQEAFAFNAADRVLEVIWKIGGRQVKIDLAQDNDMLPPLEILKKYPHIADKYHNKIDRILTKIMKGELDPKDVFYPADRYNHDNDLILGIAQEGETDKMIADKVKKEWDQLKINNPERAKQIEEYNRRYMLNVMSYNRYAWEGGLMTDDLYELINIEDLNYIAFHRYFREHGPGTESWEVKGFNDFYHIGKDSRGYEGRLHIYTIKGSPHPVVDPYLIQLETAHSLIVNTDKNNVLRHWALAFTGDREFYDEDRVEIANIGYITRQPGQSGTSLKFYLRGKPLWITIQDPHVYASLKGLNESPLFPKWATFFPSMLRSMVTHSIPFFIRNPIRDFFTRLIVAGAKTLPNPRKVIEHYNERPKHLLDLAGGGQFGFYIKNQVDYYRLQREWMFQHANDPHKYFMDFKTFINTNWDNIDRFFSKSEKINRISLFRAEYDKGIKMGLTPYDATIRAAFEARDLLDFHVAGTYMKSLNQFVVFSNAAIRGLDKMVRSARDNPGQFLAWWAMVALAPSLANSILIAQMDDDTIAEYKQLPAYQRDMYYNIPLGNGRWLSIPKPFELGYMASSVQRILDSLILDDDKAFTEDWYRLGYKAFFPFDFAGLTGGFAGVIHAATKRDYFRDKWIIPPSEMDISVAIRNTERATVVGRGLQKLSGIGGEPKWDARMVDDFIMAQFPYYGKYVLKSAEILFSDKVVQKEMQFDWADLGIVRPSPVYGAKDVQWVLQTAKKYRLYQHPLVEFLNNAIKVYYSEDVQKDREAMLKVGMDVRDIATKIRNQWDQPGVDFAKMYNEAQEYKKLSK